MQHALPQPPRDAEDDRLQTIVTQVTDGILVVNQEGRVCYANPAATRILHRVQADLLGQSFGFPITADAPVEIEVLRPHNEYRIVEMRAVPTHWDAAPAYVVALHDITDYRRAEAALRAAEAFNWAILNALSNHIAVVDAQGTIIAVNEAWRTFAQANGDPDLGRTGVGANYFDVCAGAETQAVLAGMQAVLQGAQPVFVTEYPCHKPDSEHWYEMRVVPLGSPAQAGLVVSHTEITAQKRAAQIAAEAAALRERLHEQERELSAVRRLSHPGPAHAETLPLRQREPATFYRAVDGYCALLDAALQRRAFGETAAPAPLSAQALAEHLRASTAIPRDVIAIHLEALRKQTHNAPAMRTQAYLEEGRILALELMGHLAGAYRALALHSGKRGDM
jgi:PAS domain-containing protein